MPWACISSKQLSAATRGELSDNQLARCIEHVTGCRTCEEKFYQALSVASSEVMVELGEITSMPLDLMRWERELRR